MFATEQCLLVLTHHPAVWHQAAQFLDQSSKALADKGVRIVFLYPIISQFQRTFCNDKKSSRELVLLITLIKAWLIKQLINFEIFKSLVSLQTHKTNGSFYLTNIK